MPDQRLFPEFRDQFEPTRYPFIDTATMLSADETQAIDMDLFVDASLHPIGAIGRVYISTIIVAPRQVTINFADNARVQRASVTFDPLFAEPVLRVHDEWNRPAGVLVSTALKLARMSAWRPGTHTFGFNSATFAPSCLIPTPEVGVRGLLTEKGDIFTGDVLIVGDNGVVVSQVDDDPTQIRVDIVGDPLFLRENCTDVERFVTPNFIRTINGCSPDEDGNFNLTVGNHQNAETIVRIYTDDEGNLVIEAIGSTTV